MVYILDYNLSYSCTQLRVCRVVSTSQTPTIHPKTGFMLLQFSLSIAADRYG